MTKCTEEEWFQDTINIIREQRKLWLSLNQVVPDVSDEEMIADIRGLLDHPKYADISCPSCLQEQKDARYRAYVFMIPDIWYSDFDLQFIHNHNHFLRLTIASDHQ